MVIGVVETTYTRRKSVLGVPAERQEQPKNAKALRRELSWRIKDQEHHHRGSAHGRRGLL